MSKIIDTFIFHNELPMLNFRLHELNESVDYFVLVEARTTFNGQKKPLYYKDNKSKFSKFNDKIIHVEVDIPEDLNSWDSQFFQRNQILQGVSEFDDDDLVLLSDVDEIPETGALNEVTQDIQGFQWSFLQDIYYGNLTNFRGTWGGTYLSDIKHLRKETPQNCRNRRRCFNGRKIKRIWSAGWHLSYFGNEEFIRHKIQNLSSQELNVPEYTDLDKIKYRLKNKIDFFDREAEKNAGAIKRWESALRDGEPYGGLLMPKYKDLLKPEIMNTYKVK